MKSFHNRSHKLNSFYTWKAAHLGTLYEVKHILLSSWVFQYRHCSRLALYGSHSVTCEYGCILYACCCEEWGNALNVQEKEGTTTKMSVERLVTLSRHFTYYVLCSSFSVIRTFIACMWICWYACVCLDAFTITLFIVSFHVFRKSNSSMD